METRAPIEKMLNGPIPGESLTRTPKGSPVEHPAQYSDINKAADKVATNLHRQLR